MLQHAGLNDGGVNAAVIACRAQHTQHVVDRHEPGERGEVLLPANQPPQVQRTDNVSATAVQPPVATRVSLTPSHRDLLTRAHIACSGPRPLGQHATLWATRRIVTWPVEAE
jgi:hypothetical protein